MENKSPVLHKTRIAPTPSGYLHIGNILSFALTVFLAEQYGAAVLLRIDDLDKSRVRKEYVQDIFDTLDFMEIPWQEGPKDVSSFEREYAQRYRMDLYESALQLLVERHAVFGCDCSRSEITRRQSFGVYSEKCVHRNLPLDMKGIAWRLNSVQEAAVKMMELSRISSLRLPPEMNYFIVRKKDLLPSYQLTSLVDDLYFGTDLIVRGEDLFASSVAQLYLAKVLDFVFFGETHFYHHILVRNVQGRKLSKSAGSTSILSLRKNGQKRSAIYQFIGQELGLKEPVGDWRSLASGVRSLGEK